MIVSVLTLLINKFEYICDCQAWWVGIMYWFSSKYHWMCFEISKNHILINWIFHFRHCQIMLWQHLMVPFDHAWFGYCPSRRICSNDYGIPTCNSNDVTCSAVGLSLAASHWKQVRTHASKWRECMLFKFTWAQISLRDARFLFSLHEGAVVWPLLTDSDTFHRCFGLGFHDQIAASKSTTHWKDWCALIHTFQNMPGDLCTYERTMLWVHGTICDPGYDGPYHLMCFKNVKWAQNVFIDAHFKTFWSSMLDFAWETHCRSAVTETAVFPFIPQTYLHVNWPTFADSRN